MPLGYSGCLPVGCASAAAEDLTARVCWGEQASPKDEVNHPLRGGLTPP